MKAQRVKMKNYCQFFDDTGLSAEGANHPVFIVLVLAIYGLAVYLAVNIQIFIGIALALMVFFFTQNPFRYCFWFPMSRHVNLYRYHVKFSLLGLDFYVINEIIFCPGVSIKDNIRAKFKLLEEYLDGKSC